MKTAREFAEHYLFRILGDRAGCDIRNNDIDEETITEIINELENLIKNRDQEIYQDCLNL